MCGQCVMGAAAAAAGATGVRAWLSAKAGPWLTPRRKRAATGVLIALGVLAGGIVGPTP
jgi:hypothetical protein